MPFRDAAAYLPAQVAGCITGAAGANLMFARAAVSISVKDRASGAHALSEVIATAGLVLVIFALARAGRAATAPAAVGAYIGAAYWFTASTSFANPAITIGRMFSNTFAGIAPSSVPVFIAAQIGGGIARRTDHQGALPSTSPRPRPPKPSSRFRASLAVASRNRRAIFYRKVSIMHLVAVGGSDAGISAALRAREVDPAAEVTVVVGGRLPELFHLRHPLLRLR